LLSNSIKIQIYRNITLPVVLYGFETWSLTLREELRLGLFENGVLRRIFKPKRNEGTGEWRRLLNEKLNDLYCSPNIIQVIKSRRMRWVGHVAHMERGDITYRVLVGIHEGKKPLGISRNRWVGNNFRTRNGGMDWIDLAQDRDSGVHL